MHCERRFDEILYHKEKRDSPKFLQKQHFKLTLGGANYFEKLAVLEFCWDAKTF